MLKKFINKRSLSVLSVSAFVAVLAIQAIAATALFLMPAPALAQKAYPPLILQVPIPTFSGGQATLNTQITFGNSTAPIANYIKLIYTFAVSAVGIVAAVVLMIGGLMWITAGGNASNVTEAKSMVTASITGLVLVLTSYLLLNQVNPALVNLQSDIIPSPDKQTAASAPNAPICAWKQACIGVECDISKFGKPQKGEILYDDKGNRAIASIAADDSACAATPKPNASLTSSIYCSCQYTKDPNLKCFWTGNCDNNKYNCISFNAEAISTDNTLALSSCGSFGASNNYDCACPVSKPCDDCALMQDSGFTLNNACSISDSQCQANSGLMSKLNDLKTEFVVTGAWPPTPKVHVENSCHDTGVCVDIKPISGDFNDLATKLGTAYRAKTFSFIQFECPTSGCCSSYTLPANIKCVVNGTGDHFHVVD